MTVHCRLSLTLPLLLIRFMCFVYAVLQVEAEVSRDSRVVACQVESDTGVEWEGWRWQAHMPQKRVAASVGFAPGASFGPYGTDYGNRSSHYGGAVTPRFGHGGGVAYT